MTEHSGSEETRSETVPIDDGRFEAHLHVDGHLQVGEHVAAEHLATAHGAEALRAPVELIEEELHAKSRARRVAEAVVSLLVTVAMFALVIPKLFDTEYRQIFAELGELDAMAVVGLFAFWIFSMWTYWVFQTRGLPGLTVAQSGVLNLSGSAVSNVVPFGGAVGIGATYAQTMSWGFRPTDITLSILVTGVWNVFSKLGFPILALVAVTMMGEDDHGLGIAAWIGLAILIAAVGVFTMVMRSQALAERVGAWAESLVGAFRRLVRRPAVESVSEKVLEFREHSVGLVSRHWVGLTIWIALYKVTSFGLQLLCVRALGIDELGWVEVLAAYTFGELLTTIPLTPSGVGFVEAGSAGIMVAFGAGEADALAAVFLFRAFTYLLEVPAGALAWAVWAGRTSWRKPQPNGNGANGVTAAATT